MKNPKLLSVIGARPHYMKVAPVHREALKHGLSHEILHTGQHYDKALTENYEREFDLPKSVFNLNVGSKDQAKQLGEMIIGLDDFFRKYLPDMVLVYGDTNSTAAAAIAAAKSYIPVVHVEAGLREFRKDVPEEINKLLIDAVSDLFFCPTQSSVEQLRKEGKFEGVFYAGDIVYDLVKNNADKIESVETILTRKLVNKPFYFVTIHRDGNTSSRKRMTEIVQTIKQLHHQVVFSVHPRTKKALMKFKLWNELQIDKIYTTDSRPFWETQWLIANSVLTLTDSGGISKESYFHQKGCLLLDDQIEWNELVDTGWIKVCGANSAKINNLLSTFQLPSDAPKFFGQGNTAQIILNEIIKYHASRK